jgi:ribosomal protein S12 methylthiotransferase accessory factor
VPLSRTYINHWIELLDGFYEEDRAAELSVLLRLYNRMLGPVTALNLVRPELRDLSMFSAYCHHAPVQMLIRDLRVKAGPYADLVPGGGKGATMLRPVLGALGEMAERLLAILHFTTLSEEIYYGTYDQLVESGRRGLAPAELPLFAPEQYARPGFDFVPFCPDTWLGWVRGSELLSGEEIWVPAQMVLMYYKLQPGEPPIGYATTAGLASHASRRQAILHGLYEVVERDALNLRWYSRLPPPRVAVDLTEVLASSLGVSPSRMSTPYVEVQTFLLTVDSPIPVLGAIAYDRERDERAFLGGTGASSRREEALCQALFELGQCQTGFRFEDPFGRNPIRADTDIADVVEFFDAPLYYGHARNLPRTYWFASSQSTLAWEDIPTGHFEDEEHEYRVMADWVAKCGLRPIVFDFDSACPPGLAITKVFVPQLSHACPPRNPTLGHPRFYEAPRQLGAAERPLSFEELNQDPIPFA